MATWVLAGLVASTAACGLIKVGYRHADTVAMFYIDRYLDLSREQKAFVEPRLKQLLNWHRSTQLPDYAALATGLQQRTDQQVDAAEVEALGEQFRQRANTAVAHAIPDLADVALRLTPANIRHLQRKFDDADKEFGDRNFIDADPDRQRQARYEKTLERTEEWYGRFDRDQRAAIRKLSDARPLNNAFMLAERQRRESEIIDILTRTERDKPPRDAVIAQFKTYQERFDLSPDRERRAFQESYRKATDEMNAAIHNMATPAQRARASKKLQSWIDDFRELTTVTS